MTPSPPDLAGFADAVSADRPPADITAVHAAIDAAVEQFAEHTGVRCPPRCGACCLSPSVETTVADVTPLVDELIRRGSAESVLNTLLNDPDRRPCVLYEPQPDDHTMGRCSMYAHRPSICRLFGFAGRRDADGRPQYRACRVHHHHQPDAVTAAIDAVRQRSIALPLFSDWSSQVAATDPNAGQTPQPINVALRDALQRALLRRRYLHTAPWQADDDTDDMPPTRPIRPTAPPRRAA